MSIISPKTARVASGAEFKKHCVFSQSWPSGTKLEQQYAATPFSNQHLGITFEVFPAEFGNRCPCVIFAHCSRVSNAAALG